MPAILPDTGALGLVIPWGQCRTGNALCSNKDQSCQCLCLLLHQLWNTNAWWKTTSIRKRKSTWALAGNTHIHAQRLPRKEGRKCWEDVPWLVTAVTAGNSHCTRSFGKHMLCVHPGGEADCSTGWPGCVGRGRAKVFSQVWALLAGRSREGWKGTKSHTKGTLVTAAVPSCGTSMCTTPIQLSTQQAQDQHQKGIKLQWLFHSSDLDPHCIYYKFPNSF